MIIILNNHNNKDIFSEKNAVIKAVVLASGSQGRKELLLSLGIDALVIPSGVDESIEKASGLLPEYMVMQLAGRKAEAVSMTGIPSDTLIIGADTVVLHESLILGKPADSGDAYKMLTMLSGKWHEVYTGIALTAHGKCIHSYDITRVKLRDLTDYEIKSYINTGEYIGKAGSYGIQGCGACLIERIEGDHTNVVGLPVGKIAGLLKEIFNLNIIDLCGNIEIL